MGVFRGFIAKVVICKLAIFVVSSLNSFDFGRSIRNGTYYI